MLFPTQYDVGVDFNEFAPISWNELNEKIKQQVENNENLKMWVK
jgi:calcineurin-like phosphoesterase family protein